MEKLYDLRLTGLILTLAIGSSAVVCFSGIQYGPSAYCRNLVNPERDRWKDNCRRKDSENIETSVFQKIEQSRVDKSVQHNCNPHLERWYCVWDYQLNEYREFFENLPGKE